VFTGTLLYDDNGNLIGNTLDGQRIYELTYDAKNRLLSVARYTAPSTKVTLATYDYDALGRRITKSTGDTTITYIYS
jgi:YD repeat-containing protein